MIDFNNLRQYRKLVNGSLIRNLKRRGLCVSGQYLDSSNEWRNLTWFRDGRAFRSSIDDAYDIDLALPLEQEYKNALYKQKQLLKRVQEQRRLINVKAKELADSFGVKTGDAVELNGKVWYVRWIEVTPQGRSKITLGSTKHWAVFDDAIVITHLNFKKL